MNARDLRCAAKSLKTTGEKLPVLFLLFALQLMLLGS